MRNDLILSILFSFLAYVVTFPSTITTSATAIPRVRETTQIRKVNLSCSFETDFCAWLQDKGDNFDWHRISGTTADHTSGPSGDHSTGSGFYAYIQGSDSRNSSWAARLNSPILNVDRARNLTFWYHMNGNGIGDLSLLAKCKDRPSSILFSVHGRKGPEWHLASVQLPVGRYKLVFQATAKLHFGSDIAIDDIRVPKLKVFLPPTTPPPTTTTTTLASTVPPPVTCSFESDLCGWHQDPNERLDWSRSKGPSQDVASGPLADHTLNSHDGYYVYLNGKDSGNPTWKANLISNVLRLSGPMSFSFWYHMNGVGIGSLTLVLRRIDGAEVPLWRKDGRQGPDWKQGEVTLRAGTYQLEFSATAKQHYGSDIAIDDVVLRSQLNKPTTGDGIIPIQPVG